MNEQYPLRTLLHKKIRTCECSLNVEILTLACCTLHNFYCDKAPSHCLHPWSFDFESVERGKLQHGNWRSGLSSQEGGFYSVKVVGSTNYESTAKETR